MRTRNLAALLVAGYLCGLSSAAPRPPALRTVVVDLTAGAALPRFPGTLTRLRIEPVGACTYNYGPVALVEGPAPWAAQWWAGMSYTVRAFGAPLFRFAGFNYSGTHWTTANVERIALGPFVESAASTPALEIVDRARLARFEGNGAVDLDWSALLHWGAFSAGHTFTVGPPEIALTGFGLRVTMEGSL